MVLPCRQIDTSNLTEMIMLLLRSQPVFLLSVFDALLNQKLRDVESTALSKEGHGKYTASAEYTCKKRITAFQKKRV